jgi:hypothetical protein
VDGAVAAREDGNSVDVGNQQPQQAPSPTMVDLLLGSAAAASPSSPASSGVNDAENGSDRDVELIRARNVTLFVPELLISGGHGVGGGGGGGGVGDIRLSGGINLSAGSVELVTKKKKKDQQKNQKQQLSEGLYIFNYLIILFFNYCFMI